MTKDEALRLALGVLKSKDGWGSSVRDAKDKAIAACEATLEAKYEPVAWFWFDERDGGEWIHIADNQINADKFGNAKVIPLYTTPPQQETKDEPVAYVETKEVHGQMCSFIYRADSTKLLPDGTKLYTTPLQRKPLSDEEIEKLFLSATARTHLDAAIAFARAIEAAHEIKERN